jgi:hypothetical protein
VSTERLITRVVDGEATQEEWRAFCRAADVEPVLWRELAEAQQEQAELSSHVMKAIAVAEEVDAPVSEEMAYRFNQRFRTAVVVGGWSGWLAAAAAMLVAWSVGFPGVARDEARTDGPGVLSAGIGSGWADAFQAYLDRGQASGNVVGELPDRILLEARPMGSETAAEGRQYEVIYLRQIMERAVVDQLYGVGSDDTGRPAPVRIHIAPVGRTLAPLLMVPQRIGRGG